MSKLATIAPAEKEEPYWMDEDWIPVTKAGKQRTPNMIRNELQRYIDNVGCTKTSVMRKLDVNSKSFGNFMNPGYYKDQWSAVSNGTYWAAARFLEAERNKPKTKKRKAEPDGDGAGSSESPNKKSRSEEKEEIERLYAEINAMELENTKVYDSCPELVKKIKEFLKRDGVTKKSFCVALDGLNSNSLNRFLAAKKQDGAGNCTYQAAYVFFEKLRILEKKPKTKKRIQNEREHPNGFALEKARLYCWMDIRNM